MDTKKRIQLKLRIKKEYKEKMDTDTEKTSKSVTSNEPKEEDFSWATENDLNLIEQYKRFPFEEWKKIIEKLNLNDILYDNKKIYQETCCKILEEHIFKNEKFLPENNNQNIDIFPNFLKEKKITYNDFLFSSIKPDFIIRSIPKANFIKIFNMQDYMFKYDENFNNLDNIDTINIIGELKLNSDNIKTDQKNRYITFCEYCNILYKKNEYFMVLYIFDYSYKKFSSKNIFLQKPIILGYIPRLYKDDYLEIYHKLIDNNKINKNDDKYLNENKNNDKKDNKSQENIIMRNNTFNNVDNGDKSSNEMNKYNKNDNNDYMDNENEKVILNNKDYNNMTKIELLSVIRIKEDFIREQERKLEDEKLDFELEKSKYEDEKRKIEDEKRKIEEDETKKFKNKMRKIDENIKKHKRSQEDSFLKKKRKIENLKLELEDLNILYKKKDK